jgi:hypothetical protein
VLPASPTRSQPSKLHVTPTHGAVAQPWYIITYIITVHALRHTQSAAVPGRPTRRRRRGGGESQSGAAAPGPAPVPSVCACQCERACVRGSRGVRAWGSRGVGAGASHESAVARMSRPDRLRCLPIQGWQGRWGAGVAGR